MLFSFNSDFQNQDTFYSAAYQLLFWLFFFF